MKKVILINPANYNRKSLRPPYGLLVIAGKFKENGVEVVWVDADIYKNEKHRVIEMIRENLDADLIAMGGMHTTYTYVKEICSQIRENCIDIPILIGGRIAWTLSHLIESKIPQIDMICSQEGEYVIDSICQNWPNKEKILGISVRGESGKFKANLPAPLTKTLAEWPRLNWDMLNDRYFTENEYIFYLASVGCPFKCSFCRMVDSPAEKVKYMPIETVIEDLEYLTKKYNKNGVLFVDDFFLVNRKRVWEFCEKVEESSLNGRLYWQGNSRVDAISERSHDLLKYMKKTGCKALNFGFESGSPTVLRAMNKKADLQRAEYAINAVRKANIAVKGTFIFGHPGENFETVKETAEWRAKVKIGGGYFHAQPYPGSTLYTTFKEMYKIETHDEEENFIMRGVSIKKKDDFINFTEMNNQEYRQADQWLMRRLSSVGSHNEADIAKFFAEEENITRAKIYKEIGDTTGLL